MRVYAIDRANQEHEGEGEDVRVWFASEVAARQAYGELCRDIDRDPDKFSYLFARLDQYDLPARKDDLVHELNYGLLGCRTKLAEYRFGPISATKREE